MMPSLPRRRRRPAAPKTDVAVPPWRLIVPLVLWLASAANLPLWRSLGELPELAGAHGAGFMLGLGVMIAAALTVLLALLNWRATLKPAATVLLLVAAGAAYFMWSYGVVVDRTMVVNVLGTDTNEVRDLLNLRFASWLAVVAVVPAWLVWRLRVRWAAPARQLLRNLGLLSAGLVVLVAAGALIYQDLASVMRNHTQLRYQINPLASLYSLGAALSRPRDRENAPVLPMGRDAHLSALAPGAKPPLLVLVLGETARADHLGLNGYARDTTPRMAALPDVVSYTDAWACGTYTAAALPCMFSHLGREAFEDRAANHEGLMDMLQHAGLAVLWIDNQHGGCKGVCARVPVVTAKELAAELGCPEQQCLDEQLLQGLDERIARLPAERRARGEVLVLHLMGSHGPAYYTRTPPESKRFMPECTTNALPQCSPEGLVNAYDNTIAYTDAVLGRTVDWLQRHGERYAPAMMYVSDHGESLGENNLYLHGLPFRLAPDVQKHIPWLLWLSEGMRRQSGIRTACLRQHQGERISHDHYFHSTLGLAGVQTGLYRGALDLLAGCRGGGGGA